MRFKVVFLTVVLLSVYCAFGTVEASEDAEFNSIGSIKYVVELSSNPEQLLNVSMRVNRSAETRGNAYSGSLFYRDNVNMTSIRVFADDGREVDYFSRGGGIMITLPKFYADIKYTVKLGELGKHGHQGIRTAKNVLFAGEQVFMIPFQGKMKEIKIEFKCPRGWEAFTPGMKKNLITIRNSGWFDCYSILKN